MKNNATAFIVIWAAVLASFIVPWTGTATAQAQAEGTFKELQVSLWPEYDRPGVLVIYRITLPDSTSLPADLTVRIPASAQVNAVAVRQDEVNLMNAPYERVINGEWAEISFTTTLPGAQIEYYDQSLSKEGNSRRYQFNWPGDYAVDSLGIEVQQPLGATNMVTSPALGAGKIGQDDLTYYTANIGSLPQGQGFDLSLQYEKSNDDLSAAGLTVQPSTPVENAIGGWSSQLSEVLPWILAAVMGLVLVVGGGIWYWQSGKRKVEKKEPRRRRKAPSTTQEAADLTPSAGGAIYCHSCGNRASRGDRFCRTCGTPLRAG